MIDPQIGQFWLGIGFWLSLTEPRVSIRTRWSPYTKFMDKGAKDKCGYGTETHIDVHKRSVVVLHDKHLITSTFGNEAMGDQLKEKQGNDSNFISHTVIETLQVKSSQKLSIWQEFTCLLTQGVLQI